MNEENNDVAQNPHRLVICLAHELIGRLDQLLRGDDLGGVQTAVDPDDSLAFTRKRALPRR